ncbi:MAG: glycosyltransferase family 2 protein [Chthoniobacterales bacterium]|nr:glycosyltransferase family 2 protein [Chthoniobacterales bacterium]
MKSISIVSGCFNEADNIDEFVSRVRETMATLPQYGYDIIIIDNASTDDTPKILRRISAEDSRVKVIFNARNFGAVRSGYHALMQAEGDAVVAMASDLQDPPPLIREFVAKWEEGFRVALAIKTQSEESGLFYLLRTAYYSTVKRLADIELTAHSTGFGLYDKQVIEVLRKMDDPYPYFRGMISDIGFESAKVPFTQPQRKRGITKNNFYTLYDLAMLGLTSHSKVPLRLATMLGFAMSLLSLCFATGYFIYKLIFWESFPVGQAPIVIGLFLFASLQLFFIGIIGEYVGAIHTQVLRRPLVVERERINF